MSSNNFGAMFRSLYQTAHCRVTIAVRGYRYICRWILLVMIWPHLIGCQSVQKRSTRRAAQCEALCAQARAARNEGNADRANECLNEALRQKPNNFETRRQLAETMWNSGRRFEAVTHFTALRDQRPDDAALAAQLAVMQWETHQRSAAEKTAIDALLLDAQSKDGWLIKARAEAERGELEDALVSYLRLSQVAPDDLVVQIELGELHLRRGNPDRACPLFRTVLLDPKATPQQKVDSEWLLGIAYARSERCSEAIAVMDRLIAVRNATADDWCFLGSTRLQIGDSSGAQSALHQASMIEPESMAVRRLERLLKSNFEASSGSRQVSSSSEQIP